MNQRLSQLLDKVSHEELNEIEDFISFLIVKRNLKKKDKILDNDIDINEMVQLISKSGGFDWLKKSEENIYSESDGVPAQW